MHPVIENYMQLSSIMGEMRDAAAADNWDRLVALGKQCGEYVETMKAGDEVASLDEEARQKKVALIRKILADDAEIRNKVDPCLAQIQRLLQGARQEQRLQQAYAGL
jgi:flagellar protein FliT